MNLDFGAFTITDEELEAALFTSRRIVVEYPDGMCRILGHATSQPESMLMTPEQEGVCLVKVTPRMYLYRPLMLPNVVGPNGPTGGSFNPRQQ